MSSSFNWKDNLIRTMEDPSKTLYRDHICAIIHDRYPKSRKHFLTLPFDSRLNEVRDLNRSHYELIEYMLNVSKQYVESCQPSRFGYKYGFHVNPSMNRLHLHVISKDHDSSYLRHRKHYNSFTTPFFVPVDKVLADLRSFGRVTLPTRSKAHSLLKGPMKCHYCGQFYDDLNQLKVHIKLHIDGQFY